MHRSGNHDPVRGSRLRRLREASGSTQAEFARRCSFTRAQWANYEHGEGLRPDAVIHLLDLHPGLTGSWVFTGGVRGLKLAMADQLDERQPFIDGLAADLGDWAKVATGEAKAAYDSAVAHLIQDGARLPPSKRSRRASTAHKVGAALACLAFALASVAVWEIIEHAMGGA
jgi:transcriptional regulator with XRE-family HTH domain